MLVSTAAQEAGMCQHRAVHVGHGTDVAHQRPFTQRLGKIKRALQADLRRHIGKQLLN